MEPQSSESDLLERLEAPGEEVRYKALVDLRESKKEPSSSLIEVLRSLETDPSRPVRQLAREIRRQYQGDTEDDEPIRIESAPEQYPGSLLLAIISWGSALTGLMLTGLSLLNYYMLGRFPFPDPIDVLVVANVVLTVPYILLGVLVLAPGRFPKQLALRYAYLSIALCIVLVVGLRPAYDTYWAYQFKLADQALFRNFLSPFELTTALLPVLAGQMLQIYYSRQYLAIRRRGRGRPALPQSTPPGNEVDTPTSDG